MMGNVMHRGKGSFTFVENTIFFDHGLSAKAKGIYCQIRSLENNPEWVFTIKGFASLVRDGVDAVTAGIKELEASGYIIRARKRSVNGRFLKAEEATWITLDDPAMHGEVSAELKADGFAILSEFTYEPAANVEVELAPPSTCETGETGESPQFGARTGKPVSGKATSGESAPINHSSDKGLDSDKQPPSCPPDGPDGNEKGRDDFVAVSATAKSAERATLSRRRRPRFPAGGATALWPPALPRAAAQGALDRGVVEVRGPDLNLQRRGALGVPGRDRPARDLPSAELREPDRHRDVLCAERGQPPRGVRGPHDCPLSGSPSPSAASASRSFMR